MPLKASLRAAEDSHTVTVSNKMNCNLDLF